MGDGRRMQQKAAGSPAPWFQRHRILTVLLVNVVLFLGLLAFGEIFLRIWVPFNPGYYVAIETRSDEIEYPYGTIRINSRGYPDDEFELTKPLRVGYFGDSVTYGVGAGYGHRISEYLEAALPEFEHLNLGLVGVSVTDETIAKAVGLAGELGLTHAIYLLNLNDILPTQAVEHAVEDEAPSAINRLLTSVDRLRGRSYLYSWLRSRLRQLMIDRGRSAVGLEAFEMKPRRYRRVLAETAARVNRFGRAMRDAGVEFTVVLLPYEMQISSEAADRYRELGVQWEEGFLEGRTQRELMSWIDDGMRVIDAYWAFVSADAPETSKQANALGEFFVYDKGDKLDWNHPNREGHRRIAEYLAREHILGETERARQSPR